MQQTFTRKTFFTRQFMQIDGTLKAAKANSKNAMIIGPTGYGKTFTDDKYCSSKKNTYTYHIVVSDLYRKENIIHELLQKLGLENADISNSFKINHVKARFDRIGKELIRLYDEGHRPQVIFDEAENMKIAPLKMIKALHDVVEGKCSIALIGTDQLLNNMYINKYNRNRNSLPQLYRRFKAGLVRLLPIDKEIDFKEFFEHYNVPDGLQKLLKQIADNYGELMDYLEPTIIECMAMDKPLTEEFFRIKFNMPDTTKKVK